ncbi:MAG: magnesium/cobalt transporter CorA [Chitinophagaceae bacterium]|nr:magnesium/cobalt transporter CorA [Oligoflexus sp.]
MAYNEASATTDTPTSVKNLKQHIDPNIVTWISILGLQDVTLVQDICHEFAIHRLTIEDVFNPHQRPKVEYFDAYTYLTVHVPRPDSDSDVISILMGDTWIITIQNCASDYLEGIRARIQKKIGQIRQKDRTYLAYAIIDTAIDLYFPITENYAQLIESAETDILQATRPVAIIDVFSLRSKVNFFHRILWSHNQMISQLIHDPETPFGEESWVYLRDCFDHTMQILEFLENLKENAKTLIDLHLSLQGHRSNEIMKVLTIMTATFIPMTFISGLYGMNFDTSLPNNMPELHWRYGYLFAILLMVIAGGSMLFYFYKKRWFSNMPEIPRFDRESTLDS